VDLVALPGVARRFDVKVKTAETWRARGLLPKPLVVDGARTPVWDWPTLERWGLDTGRLCRWRAQRHQAPGTPVLPGHTHVEAVFPAHWEIERVGRALDREAGHAGIEPETLRPVGVERTTTALPAPVRRTYGDWQAQHDSAAGPGAPAR
jgi:hypothetical protein